MEIPITSPMLAIYRSEATSYQPSCNGQLLQFEDGNPQASLENLKRLETLAGLRLADIVTI
jgi:hypothetical protein